MNTSVKTGRKSKYDTPEVRQRIGNNLKIRRNFLGITIGELAEYLGISSASISFYEKGRNLPNVIVFDRMAQYLGVSMQQLINGEYLEV